MANDFQSGNFPQQLPFNLPEVPILAAQAFTYGTGLFDLAAGASYTANIQVDADADFWIMKTMFGFSSITVDGSDTEAYTLGNAPALPVVLNITDTGDGRQLNKTASFISSLAGSGELPYIWPFPRRVRANAVLLCTFTNISTTVAVNNLQYTFGGSKIWYADNTFGTRGNS